jgi:hypothetical protein
VGRGWGRVEKGEVSLRVTSDRGGRMLSQKEGFQVSKGDSEKEQKGTQQGEKKQGEAPMYISQLCAL